MTHLDGCRAVPLDSTQLCLQDLEPGLKVVMRLARLCAGFPEGFFSL